MLTRDLLRYRVQRSQVHPGFIDVQDASLLQHAEQLLKIAEDAVGARHTRGQVDDAFAACVDPAIDIQVTKGLRKLISDRCTYADAEGDAAALRADLFARSTQLIRSLPGDTTHTNFVSQLAQMTGPVPHLYGDLPDERPLLSIKPIDALGLLQRFNTAQVQGLILASKRVIIHTSGGDMRVVRRVLRWLKFCRLVAHVQTGPDGGWRLDITGPADVFANTKKYGLQLAMFAPVVPLLPNYELRADIAFRPGTAWQLHLTEASPWTSPHTQRMGYTPPEMQHIVKTFAHDQWQLDTAPAPRPVGPKDMMLPDFGCLHATGRRVDVELFHRWHQHTLIARLEQLKARPDADVILGVEKSLLAQAPIAQALNNHDPTCIFSFNTFPSAKALVRCLQGVQT